MPDRAQLPRPSTAQDEHRAEFERLEADREAMMVSLGVCRDHLEQIVALGHRDGQAAPLLVRAGDIAEAALVHLETPASVGCQTLENRNPAVIVAAAENPEGALAAFVAQELEGWGFAVQSLATDGLVKVLADGRGFLIAVTERGA